MERRTHPPTKPPLPTSTPLRCKLPSASLTQTPSSYPPLPLSRGKSFPFPVPTAPPCPSFAPATAASSTHTERGSARPGTRPVPPAARVTTPQVTCLPVPPIPPTSGCRTFGGGLLGWQISWQPCPLLLYLPFLIPLLSLWIYRDPGTGPGYRDFPVVLVPVPGHRDFSPGLPVPGPTGT